MARRAAPPKLSAPPRRARELSAPSRGHTKLSAPRRRAHESASTLFGVRTNPRAPPVARARARFLEPPRCVCSACRVHLTRGVPFRGGPGRRLEGGFKAQRCANPADCTRAPRAAQPSRRWQGSSSARIGCDTSTTVTESAELHTESTQRPIVDARTVRRGRNGSAQCAAIQIFKRAVDRVVSDASHEI